MGIVRVTAEIGSDEGPTLAQVFMVDTGSFYTAISSRMRAELALPKGVAAQIMIADGSIVDTEVTVARLRINDREGVVPVEVMETPEPLIGVSALEALGSRLTQSRESMNTTGRTAPHLA